MKPIVLIPARSGSKGVPGKNTKVLNGKPLIKHTVDVAKRVFDNTDIFISTDSIAIKELCLKWGVIVPFIRPKDLANDSSSTYDVILHFMEFYEKSCGIFAGPLVLLQPTSPFRSATNIQEALSLYSPEVDMVVSVKETKSNPYFLLREENEQGFLVPLFGQTPSRRQDAPKVWELNGAIYVINPQSLKSGPISKFSKVIKYEMDEFSSHDIDTILDWKIAEAISESEF